MFKWLEKFLTRPYEKAAKEATIDKTEKPKDISEPVIAIVKTFSEPRRWKIEKTIRGPFEQSYAGLDMKFSVVDTKTDERYHCSANVYFWSDPVKSKYCEMGNSYGIPLKINPLSLPSWMTLEERIFIVQQAQPYLNNLNERLTVVFDRKRKKEQAVSKKMQDKERMRLMKVYCNE